MKKLLRFFYTVKDLRWQQGWYRAWQPLKRFWYRAPALPAAVHQAALGFPGFLPLDLPPPYACQPQKKSFAFLNREKTFAGDIDWNFREYGLLWAFHLNYLDWLRDERLSGAIRLQSLTAYAAARSSLRIGLASYPASVRLINAIRFLGSAPRSLPVVQLLWEDACRVASFPEKHLLGNHFLENAVALLYAAHFFKEWHFYEKSRRWLLAQLNEQILPDGGHFERSPAYHLHVLMRLLQCLEIATVAPSFKDETLQAFLKEKAALMLGWSRMFSDGASLPHFGDSNAEMAPPAALLWQLSEKLGISPRMLPLKESGYRKMQAAGWTVWLNAGTASPAYQPGHAHADPLSFVAYYSGKPCLTSVGVSTYENNGQRRWERSTAAHNTPVVGHQNASDVWAAFRMGRKAAVRLLEDSENQIAASHTGYNHRGITVKCTLKQLGGKLHLAYQVECDSRRQPEETILHLYFAPGHVIRTEHGNIFINGRLMLKINANFEISLSHYSYAPGFNKCLNGTCLRIRFEDCVELILMP